MLPVLLLLGTTPVLAQEIVHPAPRPCILAECPPRTLRTRTLRTLGGPVPNVIGDADDQISDRAEQESDAATPFDTEAVGPTRDLLLRRLGRDAPRNRIGHY